MASKNIGDYLGAKGDNPTQAIIDDLFINKGSSAKQNLKGSLPAETYLAKLGRLRELLGFAPIDRPSHLIRETDPYQIFRRYNQFERISSDSKEFLDIGRQLGGKETGKSFAILSKRMPDIEILRKGKEIYLGSAGMGYTPLPVQAERGTLEGGLVQLGRSRRSAYQLTKIQEPGFYGPDAPVIRTSYSEEFFDRLNSLITRYNKNVTPEDLSVFMRGLGRIQESVIGEGVKGGFAAGASAKAGKVRLKSLLAPGPSIRGMSDTALTAMYRGQQALVLQEFQARGETRQVAEIFAKHKEYVEARRVISQVIKSRGVSVPDDVGFLNVIRAGRLGAKISPSMALREAYKVVKSYNEYLPTAFAKLGVAGMHPLTKADFLVDALKNIVMPVPEAANIFGSQFSERFQTKGYHQVYKASPITRSIARKIQKAGARPVPYFMTESEFYAGTPARSATGVDIIGSRRPYTVLSLKLKGSNAYQTVFQDSGMLMTATGLEASASRQYLDTVKIKGPTGRVLRAYETLTGGSALDENLRMLQINEQEFENVVKYSGATKKFRNKVLTQREKALSTLMYAPTKDIATGEIVMAPRQDFGIFEMLARGRLPGAEPMNFAGARGGGVLVSPKYTSGTLSLRLQSIKEMAAGSAGFVIGGIRLTGVGVRQGNVLGGLLHQLDANRVKGAKGLGVEAVIGSQDIQKIDKIDRFLDNFHATLYRHGVSSEYEHLLGTAKVARVGGQTLTASMATNKKEAVAQAIKVIKDLRSRGGTYRKIAEEARKGINITSAVQQILGGTSLKDAIEDARIISVSGFKRSDQRLDTNLRNRLRITLGKFKTAAMGSGLLGYENAMQDPLVRDLAFQFKMFGWDHAKKDFVLADEHPIKQFLKGLAEPGAVKPLESQVITIGQNGELLLGGKGIKKLPDIKQFTAKAGGVSRAEIKGTLLDPDLGDFFYLDLGQKRKLGLLGKGIDKEGKEILGKLEHRYIPIPRALLRTEQATDGRVILGKTHPAYNVLKMLASLGSGQTEAEIRGSVQGAIQAIFDKLGGKKGILAKMNTIHLGAGYRARLVPQQTTIHDLANMGSSRRIFEGAVSREQLIASIERRQGFFLGANATKESKAEYAELLRKAKYENSIYSMFMADPTQRAEHMSVFRLRIVDTPLTAASNIRVSELGLDVQMHPLAFKMFERDVDNDAIAISLLSGRSKEYRNRIARQARAIEPTLQFFRDAATTAKGVAQQTVVGDIFAAFTGQKSFASLGYSAVRPTVERLIPALAGASSILDLEKRGIKVDISQAELREMQSILGAGTKFFEQKYAASFSLSQYLFQAGVKKGTSKVGQEQLNIGLLELGEQTAVGGLNIVKSIEKASDLFYEFIKGQDTNRIFQAGFILNRTSTPKVLEGLLKGAQQGSEEYMLRKASIMMAQTIGLGYAIAPKVGNLGTVAAFAEDENMFYNQKTLFKKVFGPLAGIFAPEEEKVLSSGIGGATPGQAAKVRKAVIPGPSTFGQRISSIKTDMLGSLRALSESKLFAPALVGVAALAGIGAINRMTAPDLSTASLPPPSDTSRPMDMGPSIPNMKAPPRINSSNFTPSAGRFRYNQKFGSVNSNFFDNRVNNRVIIEDKTASRNNSWLIRRQMDMESESDFAY
jgi:hypothetical protein